MASPKELEFDEHLAAGEGVTGDIGGEIFIPVDPDDTDEGTLDEPVLTTLVCPDCVRGLSLVNMHLECELLALWHWDL